MIFNVAILVIFSLCVLGALDEEAKNNQLMMLWSDGRCGTTSLTNTMWRSGLVQYCRNQEKEAFNFRPAGPIDKKSIMSLCGSIGNKDKPTFVHVKPLHVLNITGYTGGDLEERDRYRTIQAFMNDAYESGVKLMMVIRRENLLAHLLSVFELHTKRMSVKERHRLGEETFIGKDVLEYIRRKYVETEIGVLQAQALGIPLLEFEFSEATQEVCNVTSIIAGKMRDVGLLSIDAYTKFKCEPWEFKSSVELLTAPKRRWSKGGRDEGDVDPYIHMPLGPRVGRKAAGYIATALIDTPFEWMLDVNKPRRPSYIADACESLHNCIPVSNGPPENFIPL